MKIIISTLVMLVALNASAVYNNFWTTNKDGYIVANGAAQLGITNGSGGGSGNATTNAGAQAWSGINYFNNAGNVFVGNGSGLTNSHIGNLAGIPAPGSLVSSNEAAAIAVAYGGGSSNGNVNSNNSVAFIAQVTATNTANVFAGSFAGNTGTVTNFPAAVGTNNGIVNSNQFNFISAQQIGASYQIPPIMYSTWGGFGSVMNSNTFLAILNQVNTKAGMLKNYNAAGFMLLLNNDGGMFDHRDANGILQLNTTNWCWTGAVLAQICHSNGILIGIYDEPNDVSAGGRTSAGPPYSPDSEGTNIEFDAMQYSLMGFDGADISPHGVGSLEQTLSFDERFINTFRAFATNRQCWFMAEVNSEFSGNPTTIPDNYQKVGQAFPGTLCRIFPEYYDISGVDTNTQWSSWLTNQLDACTPLQGMQNAQQWFTSDEMYGNSIYPLNYSYTLTQIIQGSPFLLNSLYNMSAQQLAIVTNSELLDISYDPLYVVGQPPSSYNNGCGSSNTFEPLIKYLADGSKAIFFVNRTTNTTQTVFINWTNVGWNPYRQILVRDALNQTNFGVFVAGFTNSVGPEGVLALRFYPVDSPVSTYIQSTTSGSTGITNGATYGVNLLGGVTFSNNLSSEIGRVPIEAGLLLDAGADSTNTGTIISRSQYGQVGNYSSGYATWTNSAWGPGILALIDPNYNGLQFGPNCTWFPTNAITFDFIGSISNTITLWGYQTNNSNMSGLIMNNNGYTYLYLNGVQETYISAPQIQTGGLHEITGTYDQKTANAIIYIDGMPQVSTAISPAVWITNSTTNFMTFASTPNGYLGATIIRGRVWNRALTTNEVAQLYISSGGNQYNGSFIGNGAGLTNYYYPSNSWPANLAALTNGMTTGGYKFANSNGWPVLLWYSNAVLQIELKP